MDSKGSDSKKNFKNWLRSLKRQEQMTVKSNRMDLHCMKSLKFKDKNDIEKKSKVNFQSHFIDHYFENLNPLTLKN